MRSALESRTIKSCDELNGLPLLDYAIGWPQGVKILLEFGANPKSTTLLFLRQGGYIPFIDSDEVNESTKILIDTGATFGIEDIHDWKTTRWNSLIIKSMAERRKKLWEWARCYLPPEEIIRFNKDEATIVDAQVGELHELLKSLGKHIPSCLQESRGWMASQTVYHALSRLGYDWTEIFDELYASGFRDIDAVDGYGRTPSMTYDSVINGAWFASKGADCGRRLPNSNGNVVILWSARIFGRLTTEFSKRCHLPSTELQRRKERMSRFRHFVQVFMLHASQDGCVCPCSPDGCTGLSAALRWLCQKVQAGFCAGLRDFKTIYPNFARHFNQPEFVELSDRSSFQQKLGALIEIFEALPKAGGIIVRAMTFEGLGINHACCTEVDPYFWMLYEAKGKSDDEVNEILDEEKTRHDELEKLVLEFDTKFTELGLPIWEFLTKHWQPRMIDYLSHRDPYDEEHHKETRKLGVDLEVDDSEIPHWIHFLGNQVEELDDEGS